jgi:hypothetical protein
MKKIFTFLIAFFSITSIFAQSRNWNNNNNNSYDRHQSNNSSGYGQSTYDNHSSYDNHSAYDNHSSYDNHNYGQSNYNNRENDRSWDNDRNRGYDSRYDNRYDGYGHHSENTYEIRRGTPVYGHRDNRYYGREPQRSGSTLKAVGTGLIVGGIIALMAGSH